MLRIILPVIFVLYLLQIPFHATADNKALEKKAERIFKQRWYPGTSPLLSYQLLVDDWNAGKHRKWLVSEYITYFDSVIQKMLSDDGVNPRVNYSLDVIAPVYHLWAKEEKKEETLSNVVALLLQNRPKDAESILKDILSKTPNDKKAKLLAGLAFPKNKNSIFFREQWEELEQTTSKQMITIWLPLWAYMRVDKPFRELVYERIEKNPDLLKDITLEQKEMLLFWYVLDRISYSKEKLDFDLNATKKTFFYRHLAPDLKGKTMEIIQSKTALLTQTVNQKDKEKPFQIDVKYVPE